LHIGTFDQPGKSPCDGLPVKASPFEKGGLRGILRQKTNPPQPSFVKEGAKKKRGF
jgi:hypothetical protein